MELIITVCEFNYLYFEICVGFEGGLAMGRAPIKHDIYGLDLVGHVHLGK